MERSKRPYSIQKRPTSRKNRSVFYVQSRDSETAQYMTADSSGKRSKSDAMNWAEEQIKSGRVNASNKKNISFETFATEFWDWNNSPYVSGKLVRGQQIGHTHMKTNAGYLARHIIPAFKGRMLGSITPADVEEAGARLPPPFRHPCGGDGRDPGIQRDLLQPRASTLGYR
jgi:hypothetical protein